MSDGFFPGNPRLSQALPAASARPTSVAVPFAE